MIGPMRPGESSTCCGPMGACWAFSSQKNDQPCWGDTGVIDEEYGDDWWQWIHGCRGHANGYGGPYIPQEDERGKR